MDVVQNPCEQVEEPVHVAPSREDEERYQKLIAENEDIQKAIAEVRSVILPVLV